MFLFKKNILWVIILVVSMQNCLKLKINRRVWVSNTDIESFLIKSQEKVKSLKNEFFNYIFQNNDEIKIELIKMNDIDEINSYFLWFYYESKSIILTETNKDKKIDDIAKKLDNSKKFRFELFLESNNINKNQTIEEFINSDWKTICTKIDEYLKERKNLKNDIKNFILENSNKDNLITNLLEDLIKLDNNMLKIPDIIIDLKKFENDFNSSLNKSLKNLKELKNKKIDNGKFNGGSLLSTIDNYLNYSLSNELFKKNNNSNLNYNFPKKLFINLEKSEINNPNNCKSPSNSIKADNWLSDDEDLQ